jgi:hypothetical protein
MNPPYTHNPNPFDFVPFAEHPLTRKESEFDVKGELLSGYLELRIKSLTPLHIVGAQEHEGKNRRSSHYRQNGRACLPAASIRGCLRAFIEALTAGWVSQATPEYEKVSGKNNPKGRHIGYATFDRQKEHRVGPAINPEYQPRITKDAMIDLASYLFGLVLEKEGDSAHEDLSRKSKVWIEDAYIEEEQLNKDQYWLPDINGEAFMGGPKPSASNWWYMQPQKVEQRNARLTDGRIIQMAEFIGERYWGRKFYFHQKPENCVGYYEPSAHNWSYRDENPFCKVRLECLKPGKTTESFRIYVNRVPRQLLMLLVFSLSPGKNIRHKLGYGKAYGYGSFEFHIQNAWLRPEDTPQRIPPPLHNALQEIQTWQALAWDQPRMQEAGFDLSLVDWRALSQLAIILGWENMEKLKFTYPPFIKGYFSRGISRADFNAHVQTGYRLGQVIRSPQEGRDLAIKVYDLKKPIHFRYYQEQAAEWKTLIATRKP